jgi:mannitol/fructose-specific phosphotransferase system IIA component (Ntr-type)
MDTSLPTPKSHFRRCPKCEKELLIEPTAPPGDIPCPNCGHVLWLPHLPGVELFNFLVHDAILHDMRPSDRDEAIGLLVRSLAEHGHVPQKSLPDVIDSLIRREQLGTTAIGEECAIPHVKHPSIPRLVGTVGYAPGGVDFHSLDGVPVKTIFLLLSPPNQPGDHLRALERISRFLRAR